MYRTRHEPAKPRPTHFLAVPLCQVPQLVAAVEEVQAALLGHSKKLKQCFVEAATAHITLSVMAIPPERMKEATAALTAASAKLRAIGAAAGLPAAPFQLTFRGLGHFRGQVSGVWRCLSVCLAASSGRWALPEFPNHSYPDTVTM